MRYLSQKVRYEAGMSGSIEGLHAKLIGLAPQPHWRNALKGYIESVLL